MSDSELRILLALLEAAEASGGRGSNGTVGSFNNSGNGTQNFSNARINSGYKSGDGRGSFNRNEFGGRVVNNGGNFEGHGNGSIVHGNFDASTRRYN